LTLPMMFAVVYLSAKLGQASGHGLFRIIKEHYPRWILFPTLAGVLVGNVIEAGADLGGRRRRSTFLCRYRGWSVGIAIIIVALQFWGSYVLIRNVFRWLALLLLAYVGSALLSKPNFMEMLRGSLILTITFSRDFLTIHRRSDRDHIIRLHLHLAVE
jgi:Mn2+/Fe2+ NRAMP family transporter